MSGIEIEGISWIRKGAVDAVLAFLRALVIQKPSTARPEHGTPARRPRPDAS